MLDNREDDLFRESTMTFGQHLEELRGCLIRSMAGLLAGFLLGLLVGEYVVDLIQWPLTKALTHYYEIDTLNRVGTEVEKFKGSERALPWTAEEIKNRVEKEGLFADKVFIDPIQLFQELKRVYPEQFKGIDAPPQKPRTDFSDPAKSDAYKDDLLCLFLWHRGEDDPRVQIKSLSASEAFNVYIKASLLVGVLLASPWIFYQIWSFVAAGLYPTERRYVHVYLPFSFGLFAVGAMLAFFVVFEPVLNFLFSFNRSLGIDPDPRISEWLGFVLMLPVGFGIGFQLPLVMLFLERIGVFNARTYISQWRIAVLVIFVTAAILTPPDPYSMLLMALPLTFLYFGGILLCVFMPRKANPFGESG
jgi:sec-independent protein translocase protein TatC